jgi:hypothetical protein
VLLREQMAVCQANEARLEAGLSSKSVEAAICQASSLAGVTYVLVYMWPGLFWSGGMSRSFCWIGWFNPSLPSIIL